MSAVSNTGLLCYYNFDTSSNYTLQSGTSILNITTGLYDLNYTGTAGVLSVSGTQKKTGTGSLYSNSSTTGNYYACSSYVGKITVNNGFTVSTWLYLNSAALSSSYFVILGDNTSNIGIYVSGLSLGFQASRGINVQFNGIGTNNTWVHILITASYSGGTTTITAYVNGVQFTSLFGAGGSPFGGSGGSQTGGVITYSGSILTGDTSIYIGGYKNTVSSFPGYIDEFLLFNRVLSATEITALYNLNYNFPYNPPPYPCFLQGSKILRMNEETDMEEYVPVESLRRGDLIKTVRSGYKAIQLIGHKTIHNNPTSDIKNRLFIYRKSPKITELFEDLCLTGEHCSLLYDVPEEKLREVEKYMGRIYVSEGYYRVPAHLDDRAEPYPVEGAATIWHFALEHDNPYANYGVFANGLLVESSSVKYMAELANMNFTE